MNAWEMRALRRTLRCALCGEPIEAGGRWYDMPDGLSLCAESDCLEEWAAAYLRLRPAFDEEEEP